MRGYNDVKTESCIASSTPTYAGRFLYKWVIARKWSV